MATPGTTPTSALLHDMLREKKAQTQRVKKTYDPANGPKNGLDERDIQSSPIASMSARDRSDAHSRRGSGIGDRSATMPKEMGFKEMEEYISKINKQNFDLKLEVFHRRQRNEVLESKLQKLQQLEADNEELQSINEELLLELEKRDVAIQEAVGLICELEAKNEELQMAVVRMDFTHLPTSSDPGPAKEANGNLASPLSTISGMERSSSSCQTGVGVQTDPQAPSEHSLSAPDTLSPPKPTLAHRVPSFMRDVKKSTNVLRSMYSSDGNASFVSLGRPVSLFSGDDDDDYIDQQMTNSPRLSILSESGFSSIYGGHKDQIFGEADDKEPPVPKVPSDPPQRNPNRESRLHKWLDERNMPRTPSPQGIANDKVSSIGQVLSQVSTSSRNRSSTEITPGGQLSREQRNSERRQTKQPRSPEKRTTSPTFAGPIFGAAVLPPTPDTMSTATLDANSSTPSIITEKSLLDGTPYPVKGYSASIPDIRPHTSDSINGSASPGSLRNTTRQDISARGDARCTTESDAPTRPSLTFRGTNIFSGESMYPTPASRTLSYPSPASRARRLSDQRSPRSYRGSDSNSDKTVNQSLQERQSSGSPATTTPTKRTTRDDHRSPLSSQEAIVPSPITALPHLAASPQAQRSSSLRSKIASKFSRSTNNATRIPNPSSNPQDSTPSRPPVTRALASTQHARLPRPASLHGQHPVSVPNPSPTYHLKPVLPEGMLTDLERYSAGSARHLERRRDHK